MNSTTFQISFVRFITEFFALLFLLTAASTSRGECTALEERQKEILKAATLEEATRPDPETPLDWNSTQLMRLLNKTGERLAAIECTTENFKTKSSEINAKTETLIHAKEASSGDDATNLAKLIDAQESALQELQFTWLNSAIKACKKHEDSALSHSMTETDIRRAKAANNVAKYTEIKTCLEYLHAGLASDQNNSQKLKQSTSAQESELITLKKLIGENEAQLKTAKRDDAVESNNATALEIHQYFQEKEEFADLFTTDKWYPVFFLGMKFSPEYDEDGNNKGFGESNPFGRFIVDTRWEFETLFGHKRFMGMFRSRPVIHPGVTVDFYSASIENCEKFDDPAQKQTCTDKDSNVKNVKFNDISQTLNASIYSWLHLYRADSDQIEVGPGIRFGMQSREKLQADGDSINAYHSVGARIVFNDFKNPKHAGKGYQNGMPRMEIEGSYFYMEDFANTGKKAHRKLAIGRYRIMEDSPTYVGLIVNGGQGPDEISLTVSYGLEAQRFLAILQ